MGNLNENHLIQLESYLDRQGLIFMPLRAEILDHLIGDIESHMHEGKSFAEAWLIISKNIPDNHFKKIQQETMEIINKRFNISKGLTYLSIFLLFSASVFKVLRLPWTGGLLFAGVGALVASLLISTLTGIYLHKEKKGKVMVLGTVIGIVIFLISWGLQILHLPGFMILRLMSIILLMILFPVLTVYFYFQKDHDENILLYLHKKHVPGIERFLLFLLIFSVILRGVSVIFDYPPAISQVLQIFVIGGAGLQFFALNWYPGTSDKRRIFYTVLLVAAFVCFILPSMGNAIAYQARVAFALCFYLIGGIVLLMKSNVAHYKRVAVPIVMIVSAFYVTWALINLGYISTSLNYVIFNLPYIFLLIIGLIFSFKHSILKIYMIMVIAHYMFEFPAQFGLILN